MKQYAKIDIFLNTVTMIHTVTYIQNQACRKSL